MVSRMFIKHLYILLFEMFNTNFKLLCYLNNNNDFLGPNIVPTVGQRCVSIAKLTFLSHDCPNVFSE